MLFRPSPLAVVRLHALCLDRHIAVVEHLQPHHQIDQRIAEMIGEQPPLGAPRSPGRVAIFSATAHSPTPVVAGGLAMPLPREHKVRKLNP